MKPVILKAGIPLVVSVAGLICANIIAGRRRRRSSGRLCLAPTQEHDDSLRSKESEALKENEEGNGESLEDEVLRLRRLVESVEEREGRLEMQFLRFCELKDRETVIMEMGKMLKMEMARVEIMSTEASLVEYGKVLEEMESENRVLKRKVSKLCRIVREQSSLIRENEERIAAQERRAVEEEDEKRDLNKMEDEMKELRRSLDEMNSEKCEILDKLSLLQQSLSKIEEEALSMEEYCQLEQLQEEHATEEDELVHLRWSNACLRNEVRMKQLDEQQKQKEECLQLAVTDDDEQHEESGMVSPVCTSSSSSSGNIRDGGCHMKTTKKNKKKLLHKLRKWVEGTDHRKVKPSDDENIIGEGELTYKRGNNPAAVLRMV